VDHDPPYVAGDNIIGGPSGGELLAATVVKGGWKYGG
jgi:hypothetical protein